MDNRIKNIIYTLVLGGLLVAVFFYRKSNEPEFIAFSGQTMGPITYTVKYFDADRRSFKQEVDSLLSDFNSSLNTYQEGAEISHFNRDSVFTFVRPYFREILPVSRKISTETDGAYDPTVMPLVNAWGFGPESHQVPDSARVDSLLQLVGYDKVKYDDVQAWKTDKRVQLDFSASAKGFGVDVVIEFLRSKGIENSYVEIGGEVRTLGINIGDGRPWVLGILHPDSQPDVLLGYATIELSNMAMATSGNYFNYRMVDGRKLSHTLDPRSGYPIVHPLLSATVVAPTCLEADALATAFMVMGHEKAIEYIEQHPDVNAFLIISDPSGKLSSYSTDGIKVNITAE